MPGSGGYTAALARTLIEEGSLLLGEFKLSSGKISRVYVDLRGLLSSPKAYRIVAAGLAYKIIECMSGIDGYCIAGVATGGIPWATLAASILGVSSGYVRPSQKEHGLGRSIEGCRGVKRVILVDDVATTGGSLVAAAKHLLSNGYQPEAAVVVIDREQGATRLLSSIGIRLCSVTTLRELIEVSVQENLVDAKLASEALRELQPG